MADFFCNEVAAREVEKLVDELPFTPFDLLGIEKILRSAQKKTRIRNSFLSLKYFRPEHLLKLSYKRPIFVR
ncbi:MAG: hypothetical protein AB2L20_06275 [Mangrovibacterium sp.]